MKKKILKTIEIQGEKLYVFHEYEDGYLVSKSMKAEGLFSLRKDDKRLNDEDRSED